MVRKDRITRRVLHDAMLSVGALLLLLMLLAAMDGRVRDHVVHVSRGQASADVTAAGSHARDIVSVVVDVAGDAMRFHTTLTVFVVIATVLTVFMVRT